MGTDTDNPKGSPQDKGGQAGGDPGQTKGTSQTSGSQLSDESLVELEDGEKVSLGQLKKERLMEADYRKKTATIAEDRRRLEEERRAFEANRIQQEPEEEGDEKDPIQVLAGEIAATRAAQASMYLDYQIDKLTSRYPDADPNAVKKACWANPQANIEEEMKQSHERVESARKSVTIEEILSDPQKKEEYDKKVIEGYLARKKGGGDTGGAATGGGSETIIEPGGSPEGYKACKAKLLADLEAAEKGELLD